MERTAADLHEDDGPNAWREFSACKGQTNQMFPQWHKDISYISGARALCRACPVKEQCLDFALQFPASDMHGVWAGLTPRQLAAEQKKRGIKAVKPTLAFMLSSMLGGDVVE